MNQNLTRKLASSDHLVDGASEPGTEIALAVDQILVNDGVGPLTYWHSRRWEQTGSASRRS